MTSLLCLLFFEEVGTGQVKDNSEQITNDNLDNRRKRSILGIMKIGIVKIISIVALVLVFVCVCLLECLSVEDREWSGEWTESLQLSTTIRTVLPIIVQVPGNTVL